MTGFPCCARLIIFVVYMYVCMCVQCPCVCVWTPHFLYLFIFWWTLKLFSCLGYCRYGPWGADKSSGYWFHFLQPCIQKWNCWIIDAKRGDLKSFHHRKKQRSYVRWQMLTKVIVLYEMFLYTLSWFTVICQWCLNKIRKKGWLNGSRDRM